MAEKVVLHVGTPKAGTTYLQTLLWASRSRLRDSGVLVPGSRPFDHNQAAAYVRGSSGPRVRAIWEKLVADIHAFPGTALLTNEWLAQASAEDAAQALRVFQGAELHVVVTARDLVAVGPAAWQETLKLGRSKSLPRFVAALDVPQARWSWWTLDPAEVLRRWGATLPESHVHVVTVPAERGRPHALWDRFAGVVGIADGVVDLDLATPNESLGVESARLLQMLGPRLRDAVGAEEDMWAGYRWLRRYLSHTLLAPRGGSKIGLAPEQFGILRARSEAAVATIRARGYHVAGDLADLVSVRQSPDAVRPGDVRDSDLLEVAGDLIVELLRELRTTSDEGRPVPDHNEFSAAETDSLPSGTTRALDQG